MVPSTVALLVISLFAGAYSAPQLCTSCATSGLLRQDQSSQRSENLEDLTQQAATDLHRIPTQLAFDNSRPGNWEEQNQYRTPDGHGQVFEEQGQRVDGGRRVRYYRKNFTSSYSSGNAGGLAGTDLAGFGSSGRQSVTHNYLGQGQNGAFDQSTTRGNSYLSQSSGQHSSGGHDSYGRPLTGYQSTHDQTSTSGNTYVSQESSRTAGRLTSENSQGYYGRPSSVHSAVDQGQSAGYDQTITRGNSYIAEGSSQTREGLTGQNSYGRHDSYGRQSSGRQTVGQVHDRTVTQDNSHTYQSSGDEAHGIQPGYGMTDRLRPHGRLSSGWRTVGHSAVDQGQGAGYDQTITRGNSYVAEGSSQTREGLTGQNSYGRYGSYGQPFSGRQTLGQVHDRTITQDNSHIYQSSGVDGQETQRGSAVWDQTRPGNWTEADTYRTDGGRGIVHEQQGQYVTGPKQVRFYRKNYTSSYTSGGGVPSTGLGLDSTSILEREMQNLNREMHQVDQVTGGGSTFTHSPVGHVHPIVIRPVSNYPTQHPITSGSDSYRTFSHHTQRTEDASSLPGVVPLSSDSQALRDYYDRLSQTQQSYYVQTYGTSGLSQNQISSSNVFQQPGQVRHYEQSQTSSTSSSQHPGVDRSVLQVSSNNGRQQTYNTQNSFGRTSGYNQGSVYTVPSGQLVTHAIDLGQVAQGPDCDEGTSGYSQYQQTQRLRTYRRASGSDDLTQQTEDLTQQTQDLTQQTEDLTQQTEDLTQQTEDLTQQSQHMDQFGQHSSWKPGKLEFGNQQGQDLTQQTQDLTQQTEDLTQQTEDLTQQTQHVNQFGESSSWKPGKLEFGSQQGQDITQQTEDLTQQTEDLTQQTEDLTQQTQHVDQFGQHSSWKPGKLEFGSQQGQDLTQQTQDLTQQTEDLTQQTQDLTQQTEDLTQQTQQVDQFGQHSSWKPGKLEFGSQQDQDLTQQTQDLTQQTQDLTQQTQDLTQQTQDLTQQTENLTQQTEDLTQQTQQVDQFGQHSSWKPGKLEFGSQQGQDLTQQTQDLTQQTEDLTQQTQDLTQQTEDLTQQTQQVDQFGQHSSWKPGKLEFGSQQDQDLTQQTQDLTQQTQDLTQQTQDLTQQTQDLTQQTEDLTQQTEDLTQQTQQVDQFGQHSSWKPGKLEFGSQQGQDFTQQTQDLTQQTQDLTQQTQDLTQQTEDLTQQTEDLTQQTQQVDQFGQHSSWESGKLEFGSQQGQDLTQQVEDLTQQTQDLTQQTEDLTQQTEDLAQQTQHVDQFGQHSSWRPGKLEFGSQQGQDLSQQTEDLAQQTEDLTQQTQQVDQFGQHSSWKPGQLEFGSQHGQDLTQQVEDLTQQTEDLTQQTQDLSQQTEDLTQQTEDLTQQTQHVDQFGQHSSWRPGKLEFGSQQGQDFTQQTHGFDQETTDVTQATEDMTQQTGQHWQIGEPNYVPFVEQPPKIVQVLQYPGIQQGEDLTQQTQDSGDFGQQTSWNYGQLESGNHQVEDLSQQTQDSGDFGQQTSWNHGQSQTGHHQVEDLTQQTQSSGDFGQESSWDSHNQGSGFNDRPIIPGQGVVREQRPAPKPKGRPRPTGSYYIYPVTIQVTEQPKIDAIPLNYAQENNQNWETAENLHHSEKEVAVPAAPKRGDQGVDPDSTEDEDYLGGVSTEPTTPKSQDQAKRFTKSGRRGGHQYRPQVIEPLAHYVQKSEQQSVQKSEQLEAQPLPVISPRILEAYGGNGPYDANHRPDFESVKPNPNLIITPPETDAWDVSARGLSAPQSPPVITTPEPTTTEETTTTPEPTTTTPAPGFWGRLGHKITNTYEKAKEKAKELIG